MATRPKKIAVIGAGIAGLACARTLAQAGHEVTVLERSAGAGGRMASCESAFGTFDHGAQYFTVRDPRFQQALATSPGLCKPWSANAVRVLDPHGRVAEAALPAREAHWVAVASMDALPRHWAKPLAAAGRLELETRVTQIEPDTLDHGRWQLQTSGPQDSTHVYSGFDAVVSAVPNALARGLVGTNVAPRIAGELAGVDVAPCWTLMLAFPQAVQPTLSHLGPQWNAALSTHHRIAWLARESSKPQRSAVERWTVQASAAWSQEHLDDDAPRVQAKLLKAFAEVTGIHAEPAHAQVHRWRWAKTQKPLGRSHLWDAKSGIGVCGDWCLGHRVEDAFISGLELALAVHKA
ncbi:MAG: NAD(P)/FAD-dependent oxidoreductase [Ramlibacter sp.]